MPFKVILVDVSAPPQKVFSPPPPRIPQFAADTLPAPPPPGNPPPCGIFNKKPTPPSWRLGLPLPPPRAEKKKKIRNVHQVISVDCLKRLFGRVIVAFPAQQMWHMLHSVAQEPNRNRKPESSEPFFPKPNPEGPERHLDAARQKLPRDNFCRSTAAQLPSPRGAILKEEKMSSTVGERQFGRHFKRQFGRG